MNESLITVLANIALTLSFIVAVIFGVAQVRASARDRRERLTLETMRAFQTHEFAGLILLITARDMPTRYIDWQGRPEDDRVRWIQFSQQMESLGLLVAEKLIDIDLVDKTLGSLVVTTWEKYKPLFTDMREQLPDPFLGEYFQWLAESIDRRMRDFPRKPYFETHKPIV